MQGTLPDKTSYQLTMDWANSVSSLTGAQNDAVILKWAFCVPLSKQINFVEEIHRLTLSLATAVHYQHTTTVKITDSFSSYKISSRRNYRNYFWHSMLLLTISYENNSAQASMRGSNDPARRNECATYHQHIDYYIFLYWHPVKSPRQVISASRSAVVSCAFGSNPRTRV